MAAAIQVFVGISSNEQNLGHGFKYDESEAEGVMMAKKLEALAHDGGNDDDIEEQFASMMKTVKKSVSFRKKTEFTKVKPAPGHTDRIAAAKLAAEKIATEKQLNTQPIEKDAAAQTAEAVMKGEISEAAPAMMTPASIAKAKADELNEKLNYLPSERPAGETGDQPLQYFEEELEINGKLSILLKVYFWIGRVLVLRLLFTDA